MGFKIICVLFFLTLICVDYSHAQTRPSAVDIQTPEVTAFNRNIEMPVSLYTGVPNISIPLYTAHIKDVEVPITLEYHAGGIRVDQEATWVGLGWDLNYGGQISRKVRGIPDEKGYFVTNQTVDYFNNLPSPINQGILSRVDNLRQAKSGNQDFMPDEFYYSALGYSGKFMYNQTQRKFILFPHEDINITQSSTSTLFYSWNVLLPNGISVKYGEEGTVSQMIGYNPNTFTKNSWLIKSINNTCNEGIVFNYENFNYSLWKIGNETYSIRRFSSINNSVNKVLTTYQYNDARVSSITFPNGTINFITTSRDDLPTKALSEIDVVDNKNNIIRKILFKYSYFIGAANDILPVLNAPGDIQIPGKYSRLRLDSINIIGNNGTPITYKFDYYYNNSNQAPSKYSFAQDHYGFYNGVANMGEFSFIPNLYERGFVGGDRRVNPSTSNVFSLHTITYPEGGKTQFTYENNTASIIGIPKELLENYQDENLRDASNGLNLSEYGESMHNYAPTPTQMDPQGIAYFQKQFTVPKNAYSALGYNVEFSTNYGPSSDFSIYPASIDNVHFKVEEKSTAGVQVICDFNSSNSAQTSPPYTRIGEYKTHINIKPGETYILTIELKFLDLNYKAFQNNFVRATLRWRELDTSVSQINTGGLRIKNIDFYDKAGSIAKSKKYTYTTLNSNKSSGRIISLPTYFKYGLKQSGFVPGIKYGDLDWGIDFYSYSTIPLETTNGSFSGYDNVDEFDVIYGKSDNYFRTNYQFLFPMPFYSRYYGYDRYGIIEANEWTRGKLLSKKYFKGNNILRQEDFTYYNWSPHLTSSDQEESVQEINTDLISYQALNLSYVPSFGIYNNEDSYDFYDFEQSQTNRLINYDNVTNVSLNDPTLTPAFYFYYGIADYTTSFPFAFVNSLNGTTISYFIDQSLHLPYFIHYTGFDKIRNRTTTTFDDFGNKTIQTDSYIYNKTPSLYQVTQTQTLNSRGEVLNTQITYPIDYPATSPYDLMLQRHILNIPVEQLYKNGGFLLQSKKTNYQNWGNNIIAPGNTQTTIGNNSSENRVIYDNYDSKGNLLSSSKPNNVKTVYLWGYQLQYPVAKISGSTYSTINSLITQSQIDAAIDNDASLRSLLNALRTNLPDALVTTYTYKPLVGMTSETGHDGKTIYYEYDEFNRLSLIRDHNNKIIKKICYAYAGQSGECSGVAAIYYNTVKSGSFRRNDCKEGFTGNVVTYVVPAGRYTSTVSQEAADLLAQDDIDSNGQNYANFNGSCIANSCSFTTINWFTCPSGGFYNSGSNVSGYLVFYSSNALNPGNSYQVGFISGTCVPSSTRAFSYNSSGITFNFTIESNGLLTVQLSPGSPTLNPNTTVSLNFSYPL